MAHRVSLIGPVRQDPRNFQEVAVLAALSAGDFQEVAVLAALSAGDFQEVAAILAVRAEAWVYGSNL
jgi:hypothetical protein